METHTHAHTHTPTHTHTTTQTHTNTNKQQHTQRHTHTNTHTHIWKIVAVVAVFILDMHRLLLQAYKTIKGYKTSKAHDKLSSIIASSDTQDASKNDRAWLS